MIVILVVSIYMVIPKENFFDSLLSYFPIKNSKKVSKLLMKIQNGLGSWLIGQIILMFIIGALSYIVVVLPSLFDSTYQLHHYAIIIGILAGILEALPNIGPVITIVISVVIAWVSGAPATSTIYLFIMLVVVQELEAWVIVPTIMKKAIDLHPVLSIIGILVGFELGGPITALLSVPIIGICQIILHEVTQEWNSK